MGKADRIQETGDRAAGEIVEARGETTRQDAAYPGQHPATIDAELGQIVQDKLSANRRERFLSAGAAPPSLLAGLIVDADGERMTPTHAAKHNKRCRHYVSASLLADDRPATQSGMRVPAGAALDVASARYAIFPVSWLMLDQFRSDLAIRDVNVPVLMVHGEGDDVIALNSAKRLFELANEPKTFVSVPGGNHLELVDVFPRVCEWIGENLDRASLRRQSLSCATG